MYPQNIRQAPLPPVSILKFFDVHEPQDTRFRSCARLLQSIWRHSKGFPMGSYLHPAEGKRALGSRLAPPPAEAGYNFLTPNIAKQVRRELAYREYGALIDEERIWTNLLSSSALVFNLLAPLKQAPSLALEVLRGAFAVEADAVTGIYFETSPGRGDASYIGDRTAFDALITYRRGSLQGLVAVEVKYAEGSGAASRPANDRLLEVAKGSGLYTECDPAIIFSPFHRQLTSEHCLASVLLATSDFQEATFAVIRPMANMEIGQMTSSYRELLTEDGPVRFGDVALEAVVASIGRTGSEDLATQFSERYLDFTPIIDAVDEWQPHAWRQGTAAESGENSGDGDERPAEIKVKAGS